VKKVFGRQNIAKERLSIIYTLRYKVKKSKIYAALDCKLHEKKMHKPWLTIEQIQYACFTCVCLKSAIRLFLGLGLAFFGEDMLATLTTTFDSSVAVSSPAIIQVAA